MHNTTDALATKLLQAHFKTHALGRSTQDDEMTSDIQSRYSTDGVRAVKDLMPDQLRPILRLFGKARKAISGRGGITFPGFGNSRIFSSANLGRFNSELASYDSQFRLLLDDFVTFFPQHIEAEKIRLNGAFRRSDYPPDDQVAESFGFEYAAFPMAMPSHVQIDAISGPAIAEIKANYEAQIQASVAQIESQSLSRGLTLCHELAEMLSKDKPVLVDSEKRKGVVPRLREYVAELRANNLTGNPMIENMAQSIETKLILVTEVLRDSEWQKSSTAKAARAIVDQFAQLGVRRLDIEAA
jgi:hypothetical protein